MREKINRKNFLKKLSVLGVSSFGVAAFITSCGSEDKSQPESNTGGKNKTNQQNDPCSDTDGLSEQELKTRETYQYVSQTPYPDKRCDNCNFWIPPAGNSQCGKCQLVKGPINPPGYCTAWVAMLKG